MDNHAAAIDRGTLARFLVQALLPSGGYVAVFETSSPVLAAYFDESMTSEKLPVTSVAGYLFDPVEYLKFDIAMLELLREYDLKYFRFYECNRPCGEFLKYKDDPRDVCDIVERRVISLIRQHAIAGFGVSASDATFQLIRPIESDESLYNALCQWCLWEVGRWADRHGFHGQAAYFFEAGADDEQHANGNLSQIKLNPEMKKRCRYGAHTFVPKAAMRGLQAADTLAWFIRREGEDTEAVRLGALDPRPRRADFQALIGNTVQELKAIQHIHKHLDDEALKAFFRDNSWPAARWY